MVTFFGDNFFGDEDDNGRGAVTVETFYILKEDGFKITLESGAGFIELEAGP